MREFPNSKRLSSNSRSDNLTAQREGAQTPAATALMSRHVLQLQREVGNRAVGRMLRGHVQQSAPSQMLQRKVVPYQVDENHQALSAVNEFADALDEAVQNAWRLVVSRPLKDEEIVDGYTQRWADQWKLLDMSTVNLVPAMAGYAIESIATKLFMPPVYGDLMIELQATRGNTRPDIVLTYMGHDIAWFDITADNSQGHIQDKNGAGWQNKPFVAEICYPSVDAAFIASTMEQFEESGETIDVGDFTERYLWRRSEWLAKAQKWKPVVQEWVQEVPINYSSYSTRRAGLKAIMHDKLDNSLTEKEMASILQFCNLNYGTYGFKRSPGQGPYWSTPVLSSVGAGLLQEFEDMLPQPSQEEIIAMYEELTGKTVDHEKNTAIEEE
ncbi:hypothetical protein ABE504_13050 [Paenibacillus oryzisoli]|uniref:hypothetical protein n=1 Tax=Paenibacillus oryzisoli TaxID=1850517 RepID=UPI003D2A2B06